MDWRNRGEDENTPNLDLYPPPDGSALHARTLHHRLRLIADWRPTGQMPLQTSST